ncbi:MAG: hypothetical protein A2231_09725 [Candidatus Firestonebacteria bacterium RIFOXYA2_FULL_40_8]|nr:MAG: hypothetical protein A2231_09725 [Candidatus Firestonebacteria bacterium RIFOXYA2_FULL_40_8]
MDKNNKIRNVWMICFLTFLMFFVQHYFRRFGQPFSDIFLTITNKSIALTSFSMMSFAVLIGSFVNIWPEKWKERVHYIKSFGILGIVLVVVHILISVMMFSAAYYPEYFTPENKMTAVFGLSLLFGIISFVCFSVVSFNILYGKFKSPETVRKVNYVFYVFLLIHIFALKYDKLFKSNSVVNGIPSGSMAAFSIAIIVIIFVVISVFNGKKPTK